MGNFISSLFSEDANYGNERTRQTNFEQMVIRENQRHYARNRLLLLEAHRRVHVIEQVPRVVKQQHTPNQSLPPGSIISWEQVFKDHLVTNLLGGTEYKYWEDTLKCQYRQSPYRLIPVAESTPNYIEIKNLFTKTNKKYFNVTEIKQIINPYLMAQYQLMKAHYQRLYGKEPDQHLLFHGTRQANVDNICKYNFDWRLHGRALGNRFGKGVSFTPISHYATHYGDKTFDKVMILSLVLVINCCVGNSSTDLPPDGFDTTTNVNGQVIVKYEDNTFYPLYLIRYGGVEPKKVQRQNIV